jgi:hypothetical protein
MSQRSLSRSAFAAGALAAAALVSCEATQPKPFCRVRQDAYAARYTMQSMQGACTGKVLAGEIIHLQYYRTAPNDPAGASTSIAIEPESVAEAVKGTAGATGMEYSLGKFTTVNPGDDDLCRAPTLSETSIVAGATRLSYAWSNIEMKVTPDSNAIHFGADLVRKDGDCTVTYKVSAINPALHCGDGRNQMGEPDPTTGNPSQALCEPVQGSGLSPELAYTCASTPDSTGTNHLCLPAKAFPSYK